jgi:hypothetical protein
MKMIIWVLWPSFTAAGIAEVVFFTLIDPKQHAAGRSEISTQSP